MKIFHELENIFKLKAKLVTGTIHSLTTVHKRASNSQRQTDFDNSIQSLLQEQGQSFSKPTPQQHQLASSAIFRPCVTNESSQQLQVLVVASSYENYNNLKMNLGAERKLKRLTESSEMLWIEQWNRLERELNQAIVELECSPRNKS